MRIGIFGGSFDPIHFGHLILADRCREVVGLDKILFVPCAVQPHKLGGPQAKKRQRLEMIEFAISGNTSFELSRIEIDRGETSYTIDTIREMKQVHSNDELFLILGDDSLESFPSWKDPKEICELANLVVVPRVGSGDVEFEPLKGLVSDDRIQQFESHVVSSP
ncbi:MAG: nicotinate (nicotinamide) nucleotide adenylyltransferase, partial [Planctomycetota bacterium]